jgi:Glycosyl hydrolase family 99
MKYIIFLLLSLFATSLPIISFSQMDDPLDSTIIQQIPSTNTQSQPGYIILATIIINDSGGTKLASDFKINIVGKSFILGSFHALPAPQIKIASIQPGDYSISISNVQGYKITQQNQCQGNVKSGEVKTCLITINDDATATAPCPSGQHFDQTTQQCVPNIPPPPQCPSGQHFDQTTQQCVPNIPPPPQCPSGQRFDQTTQQCVPNIDVGAFFYPWYGKYRHWTDNGHNPPATWASNFLPNLFNSQYPNLVVSDNLYNSNDENIIKKQIQLMNDNGIEFGIVSWWGQNTYEDKVFNKIINDVHPTIEGNDYHKFRWAILYEDEGFGDPSLNEIVNDLKYIKQKYASSPYYLHVNGKPVIFVYNAAHSGSDPLDDLDRWKKAKAQIPFYVVFKVDPLSSGANPQDMDSWYQYAPASKYFEQQETFSAFVSPGFWKYDESVRLPPANATVFENAVSKLKQAQVTWKLVETWNEWGEGTGIEPAQQIIHDHRNGFKLIPNQPPSNQYIEIFKKYFK